MIRVILLQVSVQYIYITFFSENISIDSSEWLFIYWLCIRFLTRLYHSEEWAGRKKKDCLFWVIKSSHSYRSITQMVYGVECHLQQYFSYIVAVSFIASHWQSYHKSFIEYLYTYWWLACHIIETFKIFFQHYYWQSVPILSTDQLHPHSVLSKLDGY